MSYSALQRLSAEALGTAFLLAIAVGLFITAGYWFTSSTSFANPAVTVARIYTDSFTGIRINDAPAFIFAQCLAAALATFVARWLFLPRDARG